MEAFLQGQPRSLLSSTKRLPALCPTGRHNVWGWSLYKHSWKDCTEQRAFMSLLIRHAEVRGSHGELWPQNAAVMMYMTASRVILFWGKDNATKKNLLKTVKPIYQSSVFPTLSSSCLKLGWSLQEPALTIYLMSALLRQKRPLWSAGWFGVWCSASSQLSWSCSL